MDIVYIWYENYFTRHATITEEDTLDVIPRIILYKSLIHGPYIHLSTLTT